MPRTAALACGGPLRDYQLAMTVGGLRVIRGGGQDDRPAADSLHDLYQRYGGSVYGRCVYILKDRTRAQDAAQDVFAKALESWSSFRAEASPLTWLVRIATNHCLNLARSERAAWRGRFERDERARGQTAGGSDVMENRDLVRRMLGRVDAETAAAAIHYHVDEMTLDEVATALNRSVPTVRKRLEAFAGACSKELDQ